MTLRRSIPVFALAAAVLVLAVPLAIGSAEARGGAVFALVTILGGVAVVVRATRAEHADDPTQPSSMGLLAESMSGPGLLVVGTAVYLVAVCLHTFAPGSGPREDAGWPGPALAVLAVAGLALGGAGSIRSIRRREGIERRVLVEATSIAFFVTMLGAIGYATFEAFADAPEISMWAVWSVGMFTWAVAGSVLQRRAA